MSLPAIDGNTGKKTAENIYDNVRTTYKLHPTSSIAGLLTAAGLTGAVSFLQTKDPNDLGSIPQAGSRVLQLYSADIITNAMNAFDSVAKGLSESGASQILKDEGISGFTKYIPLACAGIIKGAGYYGGETPPVTRREINAPEDTAEEKKLEQNAEEDKHGHGLLYAGITVGVVALAIGGFVYTQITNEGTGTPPQSTGTDPVSDPVIPVETDTPNSTPDATPTAELTEEPTPIETPVESQHLYDINPGYIKIVLETDENLFGIKIEGSTIERDFGGWETVYNDNENVIFQRETYTPHNFDLYSELQPEQARALEAEYGQLVSLKMEQIEFTTDIEDGLGVQYYLSKAVYYKLFA